MGNCIRMFIDKVPTQSIAVEINSHMEELLLLNNLMEELNTLNQWEINSKEYLEYLRWYDEHYHCYSGKYSHNYWDDCKLMFF